MTAKVKAVHWCLWNDAVSDGMLWRQGHEFLMQHCEWWIKSRAMVRNGKYMREADISVDGWSAAEFNSWACQTFSCGVNFDSIVDCKLSNVATSYA